MLIGGSWSWPVIGGGVGRFFMVVQILFGSIWEVVCVDGGRSVRC